jgi:hypothetical protein
VATVIKYGDVSSVESEFKPAPVGVYHAKAEAVEQKLSKNNNEQMVEVTFQLTKDANGKKLKQKYGQLWYYAPLDPDSSWARRLKDLVTAFGLKAKGGNLALIKGKECLVRLREDTDLNGDYRPNIGKVMKVQEPEADEDEDEDEDDEEDEDARNGLADLSRAELKKLIKDEDLEIKVLKSMSDDDLREAIEEARPEDEDLDEEDDEEEEDDDEEEDEEEEEAAEEDNYDDMSLKALRQELSDRELETKGKKSVLIARLRTDDVEEPV